MKYLFAAACALAITLASPVAHAQPKGGGVKSGTTGTKISVPPIVVRNHRGYETGGGVRVTNTCKTRAECRWGAPRH